MACFNPQIMYDTGIITANGKHKYEFVKGMYAPKDKEVIEVPCGKCIGCVMQKSKEWATRCVLESKLYKENYFITLTYNDENIPKKKVNDMYRGEIYTRMTLKKEDLQLFIKRLRTTWQRKYNITGEIRYFACGEYGSRTFRPHYHICFFNLKIPDKEPLNRNFENSMIWTSKEIEKIWGKGNIVIGKLTYESAAYTARYTLKKQYGLSKPIFEQKKIEPEFIIMSRRPGIGKPYYELKKDTIYKTDEIFIVNRKGDIFKNKPPKYFDYLYKTEEPEVMEELKALRKEQAEESEKKRASESSLDKWQYLDQKEKTLINNIKRKKRGL